MGRGIIVKPDFRAGPSAVLSASSEVGLTTGVPVAGDSNKGAMRLRCSSIGAPLAVTALDLALQSGGLANGPYSRVSGLSGYTGTPGAALRWRNTGDSSTQWRGHTDNSYLTYMRMISVGTAIIDRPQVSEPRALKNGSLGHVYLVDVAGSVSLNFEYKSSKVSAWTAVSIATVGTSTTSRPGWVVLPSGRIIVFAYVDASAAVDAYYSDDHGVTWASWSKATGITAAAATGFRTICAEVTKDAICIVTSGSELGAATIRVWWSLDAGQTFAQTASGGASCGVARTTVTGTGQVLCAYYDGTSGTVVPVLFGGGFGAELTSFSVRSGQPMVALTTLDDGSIWLLRNGAAADPLTSLAYTVSLDNGATWVIQSNVSTVYNNQTVSGTPYGPNQMSAGTYDGSIVVILRTDTVTAAAKNGSMEWWLGGWDALTETNLSDSEGAGGTYPYGGSGGLSAGPDESLDNLGWTRTDVAAGLTETQTANGLNWVSTAVNTSYYTYPWAPGTGDGWRFRHVFRVNSGGSVTQDACILAFYASDGTNRQWVKFRFSATQIRILDNSGTLATATPINMTGQFMELFVAFNHDYTAGGGLVSAWYRSAAGTYFTVLVENQAVAEEAGVATEAIVVGGINAATTDYDFVYLGVAEGGRLATGFTNPDTLHGRPLSAAFDFQVKNGVRVGAFGGPGIVGDTYTANTTYQYAASNLWLSPRLPCRWDATDGSAANVVLYSGEKWRANTVILHGTNYRSATVEMHTSDSWGTPSFTAGMDATVWAGQVSTSVAGIIHVDGEPFDAHRFRSTKGRRWFLFTNGLPNAGYEIKDNGNGTLYVPGLAALSPGDSIAVYGDRMGAVLPATQEYLYMRIVITAQEAPDTYFRTGFVVAQVAHDIEIPYDSGFVDRYPANVVVSETVSGHRHVGRLGSEHPEIRIAWGLIDRLSSRYMERLTALLRALDGEAQPVSFWRDTDDPSTIGLYRVSGPVVRENAYGELSDAFDRLAQIVLIEETT